MKNASTIQCPEHAELAEFLRGAVSAARLEEIAEHLEHCPACSAALEQAAAHDTLVDAETLPASARQPAAVEAVWNEPECAWMIAAAKALPEAPRHLPPGLAARPLPPSLGQYEVLERIGAGGMGAVYKARHKRLDRIVALKVIAEHRITDSQALDRFVREWVALAKLENEHFVRAIDADEDQGFHFLVMEYVEGIDLARLVRHSARLSVADACEAIRQAALGLQYVADRGLVHRDIKPSNLMIAADGNVKILDLGLALWQNDDSARSGLTSDQQILGTVDFMAPEQALDSHAVDIRGDIYSLGCTLYYLLCGEAPFAGEGFSTTLKKLLAHSQAPPPAISKRRPDVPPRLDALLRRMMAKSPRERPGSPAKLANELAQFTAGSDLRALAAGAAIANATGASPAEETSAQRFLRRCRTAPGRSLDRLRRALPKNVAIVSLLVVVAAAGYPTWRAVFPPAADHSRRFHFPTPKLDTDKEAAGPWQDLLDAAPNEFWAHRGNGGGDWWTQDPETGQVRFLTATMLVVQLGSATKSNYELMMTLDAAWDRGKTGLFFGGHLSPDGSPQFQTAFIEVATIRPKGEPQTRIIRSLETANGPTEGLAAASLDRMVIGAHNLRIVVRDGTLAGVWLDGVAYPALLGVRPDVYSTTASAKYGTGGVGMFATSSSGTVLDARLRILK